MTAKICRICGTKDNLKHVCEGGQELLEKLRLCASIIITSEDCLPKHICQQCEQGLEFSYRLRRQGEATEQRIRQEMESSKQRQQVATAKLEEQSSGEDEEFIDEKSDDAEHAKPDFKNHYENVIQVDAETCTEMNVLVDDVVVLMPPHDGIKEYIEIEDYIYDEDDLIEEDAEEFDEEVHNELAIEQVNEEQLENGVRIDSIDLMSEDEQRSNENDESIDNAEEKPAVIVTYTCATCLYVCTHQTEYRQHIKQHGSERFNCVQCNKWFPTRFRLQKHEQCHLADVEMHQCPNCERSYRLRSNLVRHVRAVHESARPFACELCPETFRRADVLKNHMVSHVQERNFKCQQCQESFKTQRYLDSHLRTHLPKSEKKKTKKKSSEDADPDAAGTTKKEFYCVHCGKISKHHFTHKNHLRTHTQERPYACETCPKKFRTMAARITHERIHVDERPYQCEHCLVSFRQQSHLKEHRLIHEGVMAHVCSICNMAFTKKSNMRVHMRTHTGERPYKCAACEDTFTKLALLKRHAATVHGNVVMWESKDDIEVALASQEEQDELNTENENEDMQQELMADPPFVPENCEIVSISDIMPEEIDIIL